MLRVVFVTTCKGRRQHVEQTLPRNIADNAGYPAAKFVILDYGSTDGLQGYLIERHAHDIMSGRLVVYSFPEANGFKMAHAKNMAARCGILEGADVLVTLDADNYTGAGFATFISENMSSSNNGVFLCPDFPFIHSLPHGPLRPLRGYAGRLAIRAQDFIKLGGYCETFETWRGEDIDMIARLRLGGYCERYFDNRYLHTVPHGSEIRFREYPQAKRYESKQELRIIESRTDTVVNNSNIGVGTVYRNYCPKPIVLSPVPTRLFGIGLHKTATLSLHEAFKIFGFDSLHWGTGEAPMIWYEMQALDKSKTLERYYALSDLPIPLLYQKLDKAYPNSKYILTIRDENKWLKSVERLWDYKYNPTRRLWDVYPFSNYIHTVLYGRQDFNAEVFLARYRQHNAEVLEYFSSRSKDLLVLDMDKDCGWADLCFFLGTPIPNVSYPMSNPTKKKLAKCAYPY